MMIKKFLLILLLVSISTSLFAKSRDRIGRRSYYIINMSNESILINYKIQDFLLTQNYFDHFENNGQMTRIVPNFYDIEIIPYKDTSICENNLTHIFRIIRLETSYIRDRFGRVEFLLMNQFSPHLDFNTRHFSGKEIFNYLLDEFVISDISGNIIMTLDDINENSFRWERLGDDIFINSTNIIYGLFITSDKLDLWRNRNLNQIAGEE